VLFPKNRDDVVEILRFANGSGISVGIPVGIPVVPYGEGSNLEGTPSLSAPASAWT
jgi:FAD/FMN-containing dehydrogenase